MSNQERPLQKDMFTGKLVDARTRTQKKRDAEREKPQTMLMFSQREIAQVGVNPHPKFPLSPHTSLALIRQDIRTPEQIERDRQRQVETLMKPMFDAEEPIEGTDINEISGEKAVGLFIKALKLCPDNNVAFICLASLLNESAQITKLPEITLPDFIVFPDQRILFQAFLG